MKTSLVAGVLALALAACAPDGESAQSSDGAEEGGMANGAWVVLFDGTDLSAWRGYQKEDVPAAWQVQDGTLAFTPGAEGGDLITREQFGDFELELEWRISPGGNSGIFFRGDESQPAIYYNAPEMQILDDAEHADGLDRRTSAGSNYALHAPSADVVKPAGEWNHVRIVARGPHIEHWVNGERVVEYELGSPEWEELVKASKFVEWPGYGRNARGHIGLQDHGNPVWFRNVRMRPLDAAGGDQ